LIEAESRQTGQAWQATFNSEYIENLTRKTGHFKKFGVFARMLKNALRQTNDSLAIRILDCRDIEEWKAKLMQKSP